MKTIVILMFTICVALAQNATDASAGCPDGGHLNPPHNMPPRPDGEMNHPPRTGISDNDVNDDDNNNAAGSRTSANNAEQHHSLVHLVLPIAGGAVALIAAGVVGYCLYRRCRSNNAVTTAETSTVVVEDGGAPFGVSMEEMVHCNKMQPTVEGVVVMPGEVPAHRPSSAPMIDGLVMAKEL